MRRAALASMVAVAVVSTTGCGGSAYREAGPGVTPGEYVGVCVDPPYRVRVSDDACDPDDDDFVPSAMWWWLRLPATVPARAQSTVGFMWVSPPAGAVMMVGAPTAGGDVVWGSLATARVVTTPTPRPPVATTPTPRPVTPRVTTTTARTR